MFLISAGANEPTVSLCSWRRGERPYCVHSMMTSSNGNIVRVAGLLCGEFTDHRCIPLTKARDAELWCFLRSAPEPTVEQTMKTPVI